MANCKYCGQTRTNKAIKFNTPRDLCAGCSATRDQFAAAALTGLLTRGIITGAEKQSFEIADAMMKARKGGE